MEALSTAARCCCGGRVDEAAVAALRTALEAESSSEQEKQRALGLASNLQNVSRKLEPVEQVSHLAMRQLSCEALERTCRIPAWVPPQEPAGARRTS